MNDKVRILELQSRLDGELETARAGEIDAWTDQDREAAALRRELEWVRGAVRAGEIERPLPVAKDFYWSQIRRGIEQAERTDARAPAAGAATGAAGLLQAAWRWLAPVAGVAALIAVVVWQRPPADPLQDAVHEALSETASAEVTAFNFRSESARMTVVWVQRIER